MLLTVSNFAAALYVLLMVVMVDVDILGLMWLAGLTIDSVTIINLVRARHTPSPPHAKPAPRPARGSACRRL